MRRIPDIIIAVVVIVGANGIATGYRWVGVGSLLVALFVSWKRHSCVESYEGMVTSSESSAVNRELHSDTDHAEEDGDGGDSSGDDTGDGDGD
jgi:hypothetical protein